MKYLYFITIATCTMLLFACGENKSDGGFKTDSDKTSGTVVVTIIKENIAKLEKQRWDPEVYHKIKDRMIDSAKLSHNTKEGLIASLKYAYKGVLVREVDTILNHECSHKKLEAAVRELKGMNVPGWGKDSAKVMESYVEHQKLLDFVDKDLKAKQTPRSLSEKYNKGFETDMRKKAEGFLSKGVKCSYISGELKRTDAIFRKRRWHFCNELVNIYCRQTGYQPKNETRIRSVIHDLEIPIDPWSEKIDNFKKSFKKN